VFSSERKTAAKEHASLWSLFAWLALSRIGSLVIIIYIFVFIFFFAFVCTTIITGREKRDEET
jgi:hypothetical protein